MCLRIPEKGHPGAPLPAAHAKRLPSVPVLVATAFLQLARFDFLITLRGFRDLYEAVRVCPLGRITDDNDALPKICRATECACVCYWKQIRCLHRSAATVSVLRKFGVPAHLVIGTQSLPFKAHAWVEVDGQVVNDKPYMREIYAVLNQC
jgi:hypothetical protein